MAWYAVENAELGCWSVGNRNVPEEDYYKIEVQEREEIPKYTTEGYIIASCGTYEDAIDIAEALNIAKIEREAPKNEK